MTAQLRLWIAHIFFVVDGLWFYQALLGENMSSFVSTAHNVSCAWNEIVAHSSVFVTLFLPTFYSNIKWSVKLHLLKKWFWNHISCMKTTLEWKSNISFYQSCVESSFHSKTGRKVSVKSIPSDKNASSICWWFNRKLNFLFNLKTVTNIAIYRKYSFCCHRSDWLIKCINGKCWTQKEERKKWWSRDAKQIGRCAPFTTIQKCIAFFDLQFMFSLLSPIYLKLKFIQFDFAEMKCVFCSFPFWLTWGFTTATTGSKRWRRRANGKNKSERRLQDSSNRYPISFKETIFGLIIEKSHFENKSTRKSYQLAIGYSLLWNRYKTTKSVS